MSMLRWAACVIAGGLLGAGCAQEPRTAVGRAPTDAVAAGDTLAGDDAPAATLACLGTKYPDWPVIDPDAPTFSDPSHTAEEVAAMFAEAKALDNGAYRAYRAATVHAAVLDCAFCDCGCATSTGHVSAIDCFKDLHGFG